MRIKPVSRTEVAKPQNGLVPDVSTFGLRTGLKGICPWRWCCAPTPSHLEHQFYSQQGTTVTPLENPAKSTAWDVQGLKESSREQMLPTFQHLAQKAVSSQHHLWQSLCCWQRVPSASCCCALFSCLCSSCHLLCSILALLKPISFHLSWDAPLRTDF